MVDTIHDNGMKVLLWQIPVLKYTDYAWEQKDNDEAYMIEQGLRRRRRRGRPIPYPILRVVRQ